MRLRHRRNLSRYSSRATGPRRSRRNRSDQSGSRSPATGSGCLPKHLAASGHPSDETTPAAPPPGRRRRARHASPADQAYNPPAYVELAAQYGESGRRSRHSAEHRDHDIGGSGAGTGERPPSPPMAPPPPAEPTRRHRTADTPPDDSGGLHARDPLTGGQSVADLMARLQVESTGGGRRRRRGE